MNFATNHDPYIERRGRHAVSRRQQPPTIRGKAAPLSAEDIATLEAHIRRHSNAPASDLLKARLTYYGGLRIGEVANLMVADLVRADGTISDEIIVRPAVGKGGRGRFVPMHPKVTEAVGSFLAAFPGLPYVAVSKRWYTCKKQTVTAITNQMNKYYKTAGLKGCSTHSGRRTFITNLARLANGTDYTLRDVQHLAGHASISTTEAYIGLSSRLGSLVGGLQ
jgi:integrase/recombinase XerD